MEIPEIQQELTRLQKKFAIVAKINSFGRVAGFFMSGEERAFHSGIAATAQKNANTFELITRQLGNDDALAFRAAEQLVDLQGKFDEDVNKKIATIVTNFPDSIKKHFNDLHEAEQRKIEAAAAQKAFDDAFKVLGETVRSGDVPKAKKEFEKIKDSPLFRGFATDRMVEESLKTDSIDMLSLFVDIKENPNYRIMTSGHDRAAFLGQSPFPRSLSTKTILYSALVHKAEKIALKLAKDEKTDFESGYHGARPKLGLDNQYHPEYTQVSPLEKAKEVGMTSVIEVLTERAAKKLEQQAQNLRNSIKGPH